MAEPAAMAIGAHPDDIEFFGAGTLVLLREAGFVTHYLTVASGSCGSLTSDAATTRARRAGESREAAALLGAHWHPSLVDDLEILYELPLLRRLAAIIREVSPSIILTHAPSDYMEDHVNTSRLTVTAAFSRGMPNFATMPPTPAAPGETVVYHALPHGLHDPLGLPVYPESFLDTTSVHADKRRALGAHASQAQWLDATQGMDSCLHSLDEMSLAVGRLSGRFLHAEGWRRHSHLGFSRRDHDPLAELFPDRHSRNPNYPHAPCPAPAAPSPPTGGTTPPSTAP